MDDFNENKQEAFQKTNEKPFPYNRFRYEISDDNYFPHFSGSGSSNSKTKYSSPYMVKKLIEAQERQMNNQGK